MRIAALLIALLMASPAIGASSDELDARQTVGGMTTYRFMTEVRNAMPLRVLRVVLITDDSRVHYAADLIVRMETETRAEIIRVHIPADPDSEPDVMLEAIRQAANFANMVLKDRKPIAGMVPTMANQ